MGFEKVEEGVWGEGGAPGEGTVCAETQSQTRALCEIIG